MNLWIKFLSSVFDVNNFREDQGVKVIKGNPTSLFLRLWNPDASLRYIPASGSSVSIEFENIDLSNSFSKIASQPFAGDMSIFKVILTAEETKKISNTVSASLTVGTDKYILLVDGSLEIIDPSQRSFC